MLHIDDREDSLADESETLPADIVHAIGMSVPIGGEAGFGGRVESNDVDDRDASELMDIIVVVGDIASIVAREDISMTETLSNRPYLVDDLGGATFGIKFDREVCVEAPYHVEEDAETVLRLSPEFTLSPNLTTDAPGVGAIVGGRMVWRTAILGVEEDNVDTDVRGLDVELPSDLHEDSRCRGAIVGAINWGVAERLVGVMVSKRPTVIVSAEEDAVGAVWAVGADYVADGLGRAIIGSALRLLDDNFGSERAHLATEIVDTGPVTLGAWDTRSKGDLRGSEQESGVGRERDTRQRSLDFGLRQAVAGALAA